MFKLANKFAKLLDRNNFYEAKKMIHENCEYRFRGQIIKGPDSIIGCYQGSYDSVADQLDEIIFQSEVVEVTDNRFQFNYLDIISKNGEVHEHRCQQRVKFEDGQVIEIEHIDLEGETESLNTFFEKHRIVRKKARPSFIGNYKNFVQEDESHYPGSSELLSIGSPVGKALGLERIGVHIETIPPGRRTSWPHAESNEEEFAYVVEGHPQAWIDGEVYDLIPGDFIAFPAGTGISHTFLNNSNKNAILLVGGEASKRDNKVNYPLHPKRNKEIDIYWGESPKKEMGPHNGFPDAYEVKTASLKTRPAQKSEAQFLSDLAFQSKSYWDYPKEYLEKCRPAVSVTEKDIESWPVVVLENDTEIFGFFALMTVKGENRLEHLWLCQKIIGKGLGKKIFSDICIEAKKLGWNSFRIVADPKAKGFYEKMGAKVIGETQSKIAPEIYLPYLEYHL